MNSGSADRILLPYRCRSATVVHSLVRQDHRTVGLRLDTRCASRPPGVYHVAWIEWWRLTLIITRVPLAFVHVSVERAVIHSEVIVVGRLHSAHKSEVSSVRLATIV